MFEAALAFLAVVILSAPIICMVDWLADITETKEHEMRWSYQETHDLDDEEPYEEEPDDEDYQFEQWKDSICEYI